MNPEIEAGYAVGLKYELSKEPHPTPFSIELLVSGPGPVRVKDVAGKTFIENLAIGVTREPNKYGEAVVRFVIPEVHGSLTFGKVTVFAIPVGWATILQCWGGKSTEGAGTGLRCSTSKRE